MRYRRASSLELSERHLPLLLLTTAAGQPSTSGSRAWSTQKRGGCGSGGKGAANLHAPPLHGSGLRDGRSAPTNVASSKRFAVNARHGKAHTGTKCGPVTRDGRRCSRSSSMLLSSRGEVPAKPGRFLLAQGCRLDSHLLWNYTPHCPRCEANNQVDLDNGSWDNRVPLRVYSMNDTFLRDTMQHSCAGCKCLWKGADPRSIRLAAQNVKFLFPFYMSSRCAIDVLLVGELGC